MQSGTAKKINSIAEHLKLILHNKVQALLSKSLVVAITTNSLYIPMDVGYKIYVHSGTNNTAIGHFCLLFDSP